MSDFIGELTLPTSNEGELKIREYKDGVDFSLLKSGEPVASFTLTLTDAQRMVGWFRDEEV